MGRRLSLAALFLSVIGTATIALYFHGKATRYKTDHWIYQYFIDRALGEYGESELQDVDHVIFYIADHYEPGTRDADVAVSKSWLQLYRQHTEGLIDSYGRQLQYTWFYPYDHKSDAVMRQLTQAAQEQRGEIEFHWHHSHPDSQSFAADLQEAANWFRRYGAMIDSRDGKFKFAFVHGNWALDNSAASRHCGIDNEIDILKSFGAYADFTFSTLGTDAQPPYINQIMRVEDDQSPQSYFRGSPSTVGAPNSDFLVIQSPSGFDLIDRRFEVAAIEAESPYRSHRMRLWLTHSAFVAGRRNWRFVKIYTHGITAQHALFDDRGLQRMHTDLMQAASKWDFKVHYVTAREAYNIVRAAESGLGGDPDMHRDYEIGPPQSRVASPQIPPLRKQ